MTSTDPIEKALEGLRNARTPEEMKKARQAMWKIRDDIRLEAHIRKSEAQQKMEKLRRQMEKRRKTMNEAMREAELERKVFFRTRKPDVPRRLRLRKGW